MKPRPVTMRGKTVLIVGSDGWMGQALARRFREAGARVLRTTRRPDPKDGESSFLDLERDNGAWRPAAAVDAAILCAAVTSLKRCKDDPEATSRINVVQTAGIAATLVAGGSFVVFPSTNLVFDGSAPGPEESAPTCPATEYGRQKAAAERRLLALDSRRVAILRFTKVLGPGLTLFDGWLRSLRAGESIRPFDNFVMAPVSLSLAAETVVRVVEAGTAGILHLSADRDLSYADAARHLAARLSADARLVQPVPAGAEVEAIPRHTTLGGTRLSGEVGIEPPPPTQALDALISP